MANVPFYNPLDPAAQKSALDIQRQQALAQALQEGGKQQEGTQMVGNIAVPVSPLSALAKALETSAGGYYGGKSQRDAATLQAQQYAALLSGVTGGSNPSNYDAANAQAGSIPGTSSGTGAVPGAGLSPQAAQMALMLGGPEGLGSLYKDNYLAHNNPTDMMKNDAYQGINPQQQKALTLSEAAKNVGVSGGQPNFDAQGNMSIAPIPGAAQTQAGFEGAKAKATSAYNAPITVQGPDGKSKLVRPDVLADALADKTNMTPQNPGMNLPGSSAQPPMALGPNSPGSALPIAPDVPNQLPGMEIQSPAQKEQVGALNTDFINNGFRPAIAAGDSAEKLNAQYQTLLNNPEIDKTTWSAPFQQKAYEVLNGLGMAPDKAKSTATNSETFNAGLKDLVIPKMKSQLGQGQRINKGEVAITEQTLAKLGNTPQANKFLLNLGMALANPEVQKRDFYLQNIDNPKYSGNARSLETDYNKNHPSILDDPAIAGYFKDAKQIQAPMDAIDAELKRRGIQ